MNNRTPAQTLLLVLGSLLLVGGLACVVVGFVRFAGADASSDATGPMLLFGGGGLAAVVGLGVVAFTRAAVLQANGGYRITIEAGDRRQDGPVG